MTHLHSLSLFLDITLFGTTLGCINVAFWQWLRSDKRDRRRDHSKQRPDDGSGL
jgi:hypothetical protein